MNDTLERIIELPMAVRGLIVAAFAALLIGAYWMLFLQPIEASYAEVDEQSKKLELEVSEKTRIVANLPKFEAEVDRLDVELKKALAELPDEKEIPELLEKIADKAKESGLDVHLFKPKPEQRKDFYAEVPVEIEVAGGFHQVATFFDEVSRLERIVNIDSFSLTDPKRSEVGRTLKTSLVATSFRFLDEKERPKEDESGGKRRKRKPTEKGSDSSGE